MTRDNIKLLAVLCLALTTLFTVGQFRNANATPVQKNQTPSDAINAQYAQINDAIIQHNLDKIMSFFTYDFSELNNAGAIVNRDQERKSYQSELGRIKSMQIHYIVQNCDTTPAGMTCVVRFHMDGIGFKRIMFMKLEGTFTNDLLVHDLWVPTPEGWKLKSRQTVLDQTKVAAAT
jgi:hypothetical protein